MVYAINTSYDADNEVTAQSDPDSSYAFTFDNLGRVLAADNSGTPNMPHVILTGGYDSANDRTSLSASVNGIADFLNSYTFDADQRLTDETQQGQSGGNGDIENIPVAKRNSRSALHVRESADANNMLSREAAVVSFGSVVSGALGTISAAAASQMLAQINYLKQEPDLIDLSLKNEEGLHCSKCRRRFGGSSTSTAKSERS